MGGRGPAQLLCPPGAVLTSYPLPASARRSTKRSRPTLVPWRCVAFLSQSWPPSTTRRPKTPPRGHKPKKAQRRKANRRKVTNTNSESIRQHNKTPKFQRAKNGADGGVQDNFFLQPRHILKKSRKHTAVSKNKIKNRTTVSHVSHVRTCTQGQDLPSARQLCCRLPSYLMTVPHNSKDEKKG